MTNYLNCRSITIFSGTSITALLSQKQHTTPSTLPDPIPYILVYNPGERSFPGGAMSLPDTKVRELYERDRYSCADIAHLAGCSETKMYHRLKDLKIKMRGKSEANQIFPDSFFVILYNLGLSASQIARILGVHASTVIKRLRILSFPLRSRTVASAIRYSEKEFQRYFMVPDILDCLAEMTGKI